MRIYIIACLVLFTMLILSGCYESGVPLSNTSASVVDARLIRSWKSIPGENGAEPIYLLLRQFNENEYLVVWKTSADARTIIARGFNSKISETNMINLQNIETIEEIERTYVFLKYAINKNGNLTINFLSNDYAELKGKKFSSPEGLNLFVRKHMLQPGLFESSIEFEPTKAIKYEMIP